MTSPASSSFRVHGIDHVELFVSDLRQAANWYRDLLGLEIMKELEHWAASGHGPLMISSDGGATKLALFHGPTQGKDQPTGIRRIAFRIDAAGFLQFLARLDTLDIRNRDGHRVTSQSLVDHEEALSIYFCDPDGTALELTTYEPQQVRRSRPLPPSLQ